MCNGIILYYFKTLHPFKRELLTVSSAISLYLHPILIKFAAIHTQVVYCSFQLPTFIRISAAISLLMHFCTVQLNTLEKGVQNQVSSGGI